MSQGLEPEELVGFGAGRPEHDGALRRSARWLGRHRVVAVVAALLVVAGVASVVVATRPEPPTVPSVKVTDALPDQDARRLRQPYPWEAGKDGRPDGPAGLHGEVDVAFTPYEGRLDVLGVTGPGVSLSDQPLQRLAEGERAARVSIDAVIDCDRVGVPVPPDAYGLAVWLTDGGASTRATLPAGDEGAAWARTVGDACGSWSARRYVTVTKADVTVDPRRTRARVALTFANEGHQSVAVGALRSFDQSLSVTTDPASGVRVDARATATMTADVRVRSCDAVADIRTEGDGTGVPVAVTTGVIDVYAFAGESAHPEGDELSLIDGTGPTAVVLSADAARALSEGMRATCGGVDGFSVLVDPDDTTYDARTRTITVRLDVDGPPDVVRDIRLRGVGTDFGRNSARLITGTTPRLKPDATGQVTATLRYAAPEGRRCPDIDLFLPGFDILARVAGEDGLRTVRFTHYGVDWQDDAVRRQICADG